MATHTTVRFDPASRLEGELTPPADKSISHRAGIFGASAQIKNPTNSGCTAGGNVPGTNFVGGTIPDACISPVARAILKLYPEPNAGGENFTSSPSSKNDSKQFIVRIDHLVDYRRVRQHRHDDLGSTSNFRGRACTACLQKLQFRDCVRIDVVHDEAKALRARTR